MRRRTVPTPRPPRHFLAPVSHDCRSRSSVEDHRGRANPTPRDVSVRAFDGFFSTAHRVSAILRRCAYARVVERQTRRSQKPLPKGVRVQIPPRAPRNSKRLPRGRFSYARRQAMSPARPSHATSPLARDAITSTIGTRPPALASGPSSLALALVSWPPASGPRLLILPRAPSTRPRHPNASLPFLTQAFRATNSDR